MDCDTYHELIVADVDGMLSPSERESVRMHLDACVVCRNARALEAEFAAHLRRGPRLVEAPQPVQDRLRAALARAAVASPPATTVLRVSAAAAALLVAVTLLATVLRPMTPRFARLVGDDYRLAAAARLPLDRATAEPAELARYFDGSRRFAFAASVFDLRPAGFRLLGGAIRERDGVVFAVSVYERDGTVVVCHRFAAPSGAAASGSVAAEPHGHRRHFSVGDVGVWVIREGAVVCALTTDMAPGEFARTVLATI
jgi:anti-sigma factor RsiW